MFGSLQPKYMLSMPVNGIYNGSYICILSSHLFIIASYYNAIWKNYIECALMVILYISSINYHAIPTALNKIVDECIARAIIVHVVGISLYYNNIVPGICTMISAYMYYGNFAGHSLNTYISNMYHSIFIHFFGFLAVMSLQYNK